MRRQLELKQCSLGCQLGLGNPREPLHIASMYLPKPSLILCGDVNDKAVWRILNSKLFLSAMNMSGVIFAKS